MKTYVRLSSMSLLTLLCLTLPVVTAVATDITLYSNGPAYLNDTFAWSANPLVTNSFYIGASSTITAFSFAVWVPLGDTPLATEFFIGSTKFDFDIAAGGSYLDGSHGSQPPIWLWLNTSAAAITACGSPSCDVYQVTATVAPKRSRKPRNVLVDADRRGHSNGAGLLWDQNDNGIPGSLGGEGCTGWLNTPGTCPSIAWQQGNPIAIPSEDPDIIGYLNNPTPEPTSLALFGTVIVGLGGLLRKRSLG